MFVVRWTDTFWLSAFGFSLVAKDAPQSPQNFLPAGLSLPQCKQIMSRSSLRGAKFTVDGRESRGGGAGTLDSELSTVEGLAEQVLYRAAGHVLADDEYLRAVLPHIEYSDDVWVIAEPTHRLRFATHTRQAGLVEAFCLDHTERDFAVEQ